MSDSIEQYAPLSNRHSRITETPPDFYEALAPLGLPAGPERQRAEYGGWSNRVLRAIGIQGL
jgi:hypothetical protein